MAGTVAAAATGRVVAGRQTQSASSRTAAAPGLRICPTYLTVTTRVDELFDETGSVVAEETLAVELIVPLFPVM